jgi:superfamily I DNA and/or RNA helicase
MPPNPWIPLSFRQGLAAVGFADVAVSSVDAFQGRETDVVVLSCVRSGSGGLGFVADVRRLNVALTRARQSLLIVGDADTLAQNQHWAALIEHARTEKCCVRLEEREIDNVFGSDGGWRVPSWPPSLLSLGRRHGPSEGHASLWAGRET